MLHAQGAVSVVDPGGHLAGVVVTGGGGEEEEEEGTRVV